MKKIVFLSLFSLLILGGCDLLQSLNISDFKVPVTTTPALTNAEVVQGLKEALTVGTSNAVKVLNVQNGFFGDPLIKILFPPEVKFVEDKLRQFGMNKIVDDFILQMNRGAENAVAKASPIFVNAVKSMSISDAMGILKGDQNAATMYFKKTTSTALFNTFKPEVKSVLDQMKVTQYWTDVTTAYNKLPMAQKVETDLAKYVTEKTMDGLFLKLAAEEKKIRENPAARVSDILKKVFGSLDK